MLCAQGRVECSCCGRAAAKTHRANPIKLFRTPHHVRAASAGHTGAVDQTLGNDLPLMALPQAWLSPCGRAGILPLIQHIGYPLPATSHLLPGLSLALVARPDALRYYRHACPWLGCFFYLVRGSLVA